MTAITPAIVQQQWRVTIIRDHDIKEAIVIEICKGHSAADVRGLKTTARQLGSFEELSVAFVVEQHISLLVMDFGRGLFYLRIDVAVGNEYIQPAIVIVIEKTSTEAEHIMRGARDSSLIADFREKS